jgi:hypothetical protein
MRQSEQPRGMPSPLGPPDPALDLLVELLRRSSRARAGMVGDEGGDVAIVGVASG